MEDIFVIDDGIIRLIKAFDNNKADNKPCKNELKVNKSLISGQEGFPNVILVISMIVIKDKNEIIE